MNEIVSMRVENFLSFGEADFDFEDAGFVLVEGDNGAGKSAMVDALVWCLHGTTLRGYEKDEVVHRRVGKDCLVRVSMRDAQGEWSVQRARRHSRLRDGLSIVEDGVDRSLSGAKETQAKIHERLGCSRKTFLSSVVFGQDRAYRFSSLTDSEQKEILDEVLGVERFAVACGAARKLATKLQGELESLGIRFARAEDAVAEAESEVADLKLKDADFASSQMQKIVAVRGKLVEAKQQLDKARRFRDVGELSEVLDGANHAVATYERKLAKATEAEASAAALLSSAAIRAAANAKLIADSDRLGGSCPTCGQKPTKRLNALLKEAREKADGVAGEAAEASRQRDAAATAAGIARTKLREARAASAEAQLAHDSAVRLDADAESWRRRRADCEARIAELEAETNPYAELVEKALARSRKHQVQVDALDDEIKAVEHHLAAAQFWVKAFGNAGLRSLLVDSSLPLLNEEASRVSLALTGGDISIEFSAQTEQKSGKVVDRFEVRVDNRHGAGDYAGNSAGERAKVDLCVGLALQRLVAQRSSASFNLAIYDEVFDHLDQASHERVVDVLSGLDRATVLVVSHDDDLKAWFPASWRMVKRGGFSVVET